MNKNYIAWLVGDKKSENTIKNYVKYVEKFLEHTGKSETEITKQDFIAYKASIANLSSASMALQINSIKSYFRFLKEMDIIVVNPIEDMKAPKIKNKVKPYMTEADMRALLDHVASARDRALVALMASTGLRMFEMSEITMTQWMEMLANNNRQIVVTGKGDKERAIYINDMVMEYVEQYLSRRKNMDKAVYLFETLCGNTLDDSNLNKMLKRSAMRANLPYADKVTCHALRAGFATIASSKGVPVAVISASLGHSSISTTSRYIKTCENDINNTMMNMVF